MNSSVDKKKELGLWLKLLLTKHGLRQNKLAAELGVTCQYVSQICVGKTSLPLNHFDRIHKLLLSQGASDDDLKKLSYLYVDSRVSLPDSMQISNDDYYHLLQELKGYVEKERVINACLETAVGTRNYDDAMQAILNTISTYAARQYCYIYRYEPAAVRLMYSWHAPDVPPIKGFELIDLPTPTLWDKTLEAHELINIYDPGETQLVPRDIAELFRRNNFRAVLGTGLWADGRLYGFIILASLKQIRRFSELEERWYCRRPGSSSCSPSARPPRSGRSGRRPKPTRCCTECRFPLSDSAERASWSRSMPPVSSCWGVPPRSSADGTLPTFSASRRIRRSP